MAEPDRELERGRDAFTRGAWLGAFEALSVAVVFAPLAPADLERLGRSAYMIGRDDDYVAAFERAHQAYLDVEDGRAAVRCSFWIGHNLLFRGESARAAGWFARAQRLLEQEPADCVERGYVLQARMLEHEVSGNFDGASAVAADIAEIGERFGDRDLVAIGLMVRGHALIRLGRRAEGVRLVDETMVAATTGELSPIVTGIVHCYTISFCRDVYELGRAREWTAALTRWCDHQPEMVAHKGLCLVHRAELMTLAGAWDEARDEVGRVGQLFTDGVLNRLAQGGAAYCEGELDRLRGDFKAAEAAYRRASGLGREPQPGLALLRLAQGDQEAAAAAIRRAVTETVRPFERAALLPAYVDIMVALGDLEAATVACQELEQIAEDQSAEALDAIAAFARGRVALASGSAAEALVALRRAVSAWQAMDASHEVSRARVMVGLACRSMGDEDTAGMEFDSARSVFQALGAEPALGWLESLTEGARSSPTYGLTGREVEVLRLIAAGKRNREIAQDLVVSEHTVARHVQNIFVKLGVSSRTAASAFAFEHDLV
ncbi:MAG TPA: LuxR C-terminal-related transcriptional regulator [Acidimicrobiales bacterium]